MARTSLPGNSLAPSAARVFARRVLGEWAREGAQGARPAAARISDRLVQDASLLVSELVTNAVVHAGTDVGLLCRWEEQQPLEGEAEGEAEGHGGVADIEFAHLADPTDPVGPARPADLAEQPSEPHHPAYAPECAADDVDTAPHPEAEPVPTPGTAPGIPAPGSPADLDADPDPDSELLADSGALVIEVSDQHPARPINGAPAARSSDAPEYGRGLQLVARLATAWGVTYRPGTKTVWARIPVHPRGTGVPGAVPDEWGCPDEVVMPGYEAVAGYGVMAGAAPDGTRPTGPGWPAPGGADAPGPAGPLPSGPAPDLPARAPGADPAVPWTPGGDSDWVGRGALSFLAEASELLAGQLDEDLVATLAGQLLVPRLADWCAVWLGDEADGSGPGTCTPPGSGPRLARVWHGSEERIEELRRVLEKEPPLPTEDPARSGAVPVRWPGASFGADEPLGACVAFGLVAGGRPLGTLLIGRSGLLRFPDEVTGLVEDFCRRVALAIGAARQYARQATISRVLQRGLLPSAVAEIPGMRSALVYEPRERGGPGGDFYDVFPAGRGRWCFALGDVQGKGPEAAVVVGLARPWLRLLAREGYAVGEVLDRLNQLLLDDATEAAEAGARALAGAEGGPLSAEGFMPRFLSTLYGELVPTADGVRCTLASAGHPLPLVLRPDGEVCVVAGSQMLLGVVEDVTYRAESFDLAPGDTLLCVTDGVTERRAGRRQFDDAEGLAVALSGCAGLSAGALAERLRQQVHAFGDAPPEDDLAILVLQAV
ncbi:SpoIIE family protein phosphatase [Streptomyces sp. NPDC059816]|uniref:SpoIIE family protein phosphatase n=1 Tax=Streptomyces sp. NPDC059816 TaxID=3346960 RepID=UPI003662C579